MIIADEFRNLYFQTKFLTKEKKVLKKEKKTDKARWDDKACG